MYCIVCVCSTSLLRAFSLSPHSLFYPFAELSVIPIIFEIVLGHLPPGLVPPDFCPLRTPATWTFAPRTIANLRHLPPRHLHRWDICPLRTYAPGHLPLDIWPLRTSAPPPPDICTRRPSAPGYLPFGNDKTLLNDVEELVTS